MKKFRYRVFLIFYAPVLPIYWIGMAIVDLWKEDSLISIYKDWWKAFKKGERI